LAIPEMMRLFVDVERLPWDKVSRTGFSGKVLENEFVPSPEN